MAVDGQVYMTITTSWTEFNLAVLEATKGWEQLARALRRAYSGPAKLCIDGQQYHRRQRNRAKRRR